MAKAAVKSFEALFTRDGVLKRSLGPAHKGWRADNVQALLVALLAAVDGKQDIIKAKFSRRTVMVMLGR